MMIVGVRGLRQNEPLGITPMGTGHSARWIAVWGRDLDQMRAARRATCGLKWVEEARLRHLGYPVWATKGGPVLFLRLGAIPVGHG